MINQKWCIKKSKIAGQGVFAQKDLSKGFILGKAFQKKKDTGIPDKDYHRTKLGEKINHSAKPNAQLVKKERSFYVKIIKKVTKREEITLNYQKIPWAGKRRFYSSSKSTPAS